MKKIITLLIALILLLPVVVKADAVVVQTYYNSKVMVDGEVELHVPLQYITDYDLIFEYDKAYLETSKEQVTLSQPTSITIENDQRKEVKNLFDVKIEDGKVYVKTKVVQSTGIISTPPTPEINIKFKAIKEGETSINIDGKVLYRNEVTKITIIPKNCPQVADCEGETTESNEIVNVPEDTRPVANKNLIYISFGLNAVIFIGLLAILLTKKKPKNEETK